MCSLKVSTAAFAEPSWPVCCLLCFSMFSDLRYLECPVLGWQPWAVEGMHLNTVPFISQFVVTKIVLWQSCFWWCASLELFFKLIIGFWGWEEKECSEVLLFLISIFSKNQNLISSVQPSCRRDCHFVRGEAEGMKGQSIYRASIREKRLTKELEPNIRSKNAPDDNIQCDLVSGHSPPGVYSTVCNE